MHIASGTQVEILTMLDQWNVNSMCKFHCPPHYSRIHHRLSVVGDTYNTCLLHRGNRGELFSGAILCDCADGINVYDGKPPCTLDDVASDSGLIIYRISIRHAADGCETPGRCR